MKIPRNFDVSNLKAGNEDFNRFVSEMIASIATVINGEISFTDNFKASIVNVTFGSANAQQAVKHSLGKVPIGFINIGSNASASLYRGTSPSTTQAIFLQSTVATSMTILVF